MIIDQIIANGEYTVGDSNESNYEYYRFDFNKNTCEIEINLQAAPYGKFPGNSEEEQKANQIAKRRAMVEKLKGELNAILGQNANQFYTVEKDSRKLSIKPDSFAKIGEYINSHRSGSELLYIGMNIVNIFYGLYFRHDIGQQLIKQLLLNKLDGLAVYRKDDSGEATRYKKTHQIYIGKDVPNSPDAPVKANISSHLGQQLRDAFKAGIAKILNKSTNEVFLDSHYYDLNALSFNMSDGDFNTLAAKVGANNIVYDQAETLEHRDNRSIEVEGMQRNAKEEESIFLVAEGEIRELNEAVFDHYRLQLPLHTEKEQLIKTVQAKFLAVRDVEKLSAMYKYINAEANKRVLNIHEHSIYDSIFFKSNTNSWQKMIEEIRNHALEVVFTNTFDQPMAVILGGIKDNSLVLGIDGAERIKRSLEPYLTNPLFCEHRSNNFFRNLFHSTSAVKKLQTVIDYCDAKIKSENALNAPRLSKLEQD